MKRIKQVGRKPKLDPKKNRYVFYLNDVDNAKFLARFDLSEMKVLAHFITSIIFGKTVKVVKIDKALSDYYMRLTNFWSQFRAVGNNYNQTVVALKTNFSERTARALLYDLEQQTIELVKLNRQIIELTDEFEQKHLNWDDKAIQI